MFLLPGHSSLRYSCRLPCHAESADSSLFRACSKSKSVETIETEERTLALLFPLTN
ncbi:hypothetical protein V6Z11_D02G225500 [Gossypium hirsutum]